MLGSLVGLSAITGSALAFTGIAIALMVILCRPRHTGTKCLVAALLCELAMATFERLDHEVFRLTGGIVSGHSIKHLLVGVALGFVFWWLRARTALPPRTGAA